MSIPIPNGEHDCHSERVRVLSADPGLAAALPERARRAAEERAWANVAHLATGPADLPTDAERFVGWFGLLVLDGALFRHVDLDRITWPELLGPGDLVRPWTNTSEQLASVSVRGRYQAIEPVRVALLDREFALRVAAWPEIAAALLDRAVERSRSLAYHLAAIQPAHVDERVWLVLWHLADRWGRMTPAGVELSHPWLNHSVIAAMLGARRPTISTSVRRLCERGLLSYRPRAGWTLHPPPTAFASGRPPPPAAAEPAAPSTSVQCCR